jgi:kinesin family protein 2/24
VVEVMNHTNGFKERKPTTNDKIEQIKFNREQRRIKMEEARKLKSEREANNELQGIKVDVDFQAMVEQERKKCASKKPHTQADKMKISVCFKKRPIFSQELANGEIDIVSVNNPKITVHECKFKVDGITKTVENNDFKFDNAFCERSTNEELYFFQVKPLLDLIFNQGIVTIFAYGQTGSGKTYTMNGIQDIAVKDLFERGIDYWENHQRNFTVTVSMYEIYGGKLYDLLNDHEQLKIQEDKNNTIQVAGLKEVFVDNDDHILELIRMGNSVRTTHATKANDTSSRSHAITQIKI